MNSAPRGHRPIRSFVRREARLTPGQRRALEELWPRYGVATAEGLIDFRALFGRVAPIVIEIGFGSGAALLDAAERHPENDYLGIEVHRPGVGQLLRGAQERDLANLRVILGDAVETLEKRIADSALAAVHLFFPDPWPKKRHHKRRLVQPAFAALAARKLAVGGCLHLATDWEDYAAQMLAVLSDHPAFENVAGAGRFAPRGERPATRFEQRGERLGHAVRDLLFRRRADRP